MHQHAHPSVSPPVGLSVRLLGPGQVVGSRFLPSESLDQLLHPPPEAQLVQRIVAPTCDVRTTWEKELEKEPELKKIFTVRLTRLGIKFGELNFSFQVRHSPLSQV